MHNEQKILEGFSNIEKGAYLSAIAAMATADRQATAEEMDYLEKLIGAADLSPDQQEFIRRAAVTQINDDDLRQCLDQLKKSELRFSLVSDVIAFAQVDSNYDLEEKKKVKLIADYLGVDEEQFSALNEFTRKAAETDSASVPENEASQQDFLSSLGLGDTLKKAGINSSALLKGALGILGPLFLARMLRGKGNRNSGGLGGSLGGLLRGGGILGDLLGGGRGFGGLGGMLGRIFGKR